MMFLKIWLLVAFVCHASSQVVWQPEFTDGDCYFASAGRIGNCLEMIEEFGQIFTRTLGYSKMCSARTTCQGCHGPNPWGSTPWFNDKIFAIHNAIRLCLSNSDNLMVPLTLQFDATRWRDAQKFACKDVGECQFGRCSNCHCKTPNCVCGGEASAGSFVFGTYCSCDQVNFPDYQRAVPARNAYAFQNQPSVGFVDPFEHIIMTNATNGVLPTNATEAASVGVSPDFFLPAKRLAYQQLFLKRYAPLIKDALPYAALASHFARLPSTNLSALITPTEGWKPFQITYMPANAWSSLVDLSPVPDFMVGRADNGDAHIPSPKKDFPQSGMYKPMSVKDVLDASALAVGWCDAPRTLTAGCQVDTGKNRISGIGTERGCVGYGRCPTGSNRKPCSGHGTCLLNGKCLCDMTFRDEWHVDMWIGDACDVFVSGDTYDDDGHWGWFLPPQGSFFPAGTRGVCQYRQGEFESENICTCESGWIGDPMNPDHVELYRRVFFSRVDPARSRPLTPKIDPVQLYMRFHQCAIWTGIDSGGYRWEDAGVVIESLPGDHVGQAYVNVPFFRQPTWQLSGENGAKSDGYQCLDERTLPSSWLVDSEGNQRTPRLFGGSFGCRLCPLCVQGQGTCATQTDGTTTYCKCLPNFTGALCEIQVCPNSTTDTVCGAPHNGTCITPSTPNVAGSCTCYDGWTGPACQNQVCPKGLNGRICSGHGHCDETSGSCVCDSGWTSVANGSCLDMNRVGGVCSALNACEHRQCPSDVHGVECHGVVAVSSPVSVCNRAEDAPYCQCQLTVNANNPGSAITTGFYGTACEQAYKDSTSCTVAGDPLPCSGSNGASCLVTGKCARSSARECQSIPPRCVCPTSTTGDFCERSLCTGSSPSIACHYQQPNNGSFAASGSCQGYCNGIENSGGTCPVAIQWKCKCGTLDVLSGAFETCGTGHHSSGCALFGSQADDGWGRCETPKLGCTTYDGVKYELCNGVSRLDGTAICKRNSSLSAPYDWYCDCPVGYNDTLCKQHIPCDGLCNPLGGTCQPPCICNSDFFTGTYCDQNMCNLTGGNLTTPVSDSRRGSYCTCPNGTVYSPTAATASGSLPYSEYREIKGCMKVCLGSANGECGTFHVRRCNNTALVTGGSPVYANDTTKSVACNCSINAPLPSQPNGRAVRWIADATEGCVPYCVRGTDSGSGDCNCTGLAYGGPRCDTLACGNGGVLSGIGSNCTCPNRVGVEFPWNVSLACFNDTCAPLGLYSGETTCSCMPPYVRSTNLSSPWCTDPCVPSQGVANTTSGKCSCDKFFTGEFCQTELCVNGTINDARTNCTCIQTGAVWNNTLQQCRFENCMHGTVNSDGNCTCDALWGGVNCDIDLCTFHNGTAVWNATSQSWGCACNPGYSIPEDSATGYCTLTPCAPGYAYECEGVCHPGADPNRIPPCCVYSGFNYNCKCPKGIWFLEGTCVAEDACGENGVMAFNGSSRTIYCDCLTGFTGPTCQERRCNATTGTWNEGTKKCICKPPFTGSDCTQNTCGAGGTGVTITSDGYSCACKTGYVAGSGELITTGNASYACKLDCFASGTDFALQDQCICRDSYTGQLCDKFEPVTVRLAKTREFEPWEIALAVVGFIVLAVSGWVAYEVLWQKKPCAWNTFLSRETPLKQGTGRRWQARLHL